MTLEGLRIVCGLRPWCGLQIHAVRVAENWGPRLSCIGNHPDGKNINKECGSMHPTLMCQKVWEHRAECGFGA